MCSCSKVRAPNNRRKVRVIRGRASSQSHLPREQEEIGDSL